MKTCLYRYIASATRKSPDRITGHSVEYKSWCIHDLFVSMGYDVTVLNWRDKEFEITRTYDVVFDILDLRQLKTAFSDDTIKIFHLTGADNVWRNEQGLRRAEELNQRRGCSLPYARFIQDPEAVYESIEIADLAVLGGNEWTLHTYPEKYWDKIRLINSVATPGGA